MQYDEFLARRMVIDHGDGFKVADADVNPQLFDFQRALVRWACEKGRAAIFADCGLGKTPIQLEWARLVCERHGGIVLIVAPLAVAEQTAREGDKFGVPVNVCRTGENLTLGVNITNYEMLGHFTPDALGGIVLDESSILKSYDGKTRTEIIAFAERLPFRLACTATPAPNDPAELCNHAEFLGVMTESEVKALYFTTDGTTTRWRLKGHSHEAFYRWMATWAVAMRKPSDLGFEDGAFELPALDVREVVVPGENITPDALFTSERIGIAERRQARRASMTNRVQAAADLVFASWGTTGSCDKLAACGSQSTQSAVGSGTTPIQQSVNGGSPRCEAQKRTANTCAPTTATTPRSSSAAGNSKTASTQQSESDTATTPSTASDAELPAEDATRTPSETLGCVPTSESPLLNTMPFSTVKVEGVPSVGSPPETVPDAGSTSTTATPQGTCAGCCAPRATSESASSETTLNSCDVPPGTSTGPEPWIIWCDLNAEQRALEAAFGDDAISVYGNLPYKEKAARILAWLDGERPVLISKPSVTGYGLNMQRASKMAFVGLSDSYEQFYQAMRRCWRFGQTRPVTVHVVTSDAEGAVVQNVKRKEREANETMARIVQFTHDAVGGRNTRQEAEYREDVEEGGPWTLYLGDCVEVTKRLPSESVALSVFSPPFPGMYTYSNSVRDVGNAHGIEDLMAHFGYLAPELLRITMPGRSAFVHLTQYVAHINSDGFAGLKDFRGRTIAMMEAAGWRYYGEITVDKNPQVKAIRTKDRGLLFKTLATDSAHMHVALPDWILHFRKDGENPAPIRSGQSDKYGNHDGWITQEEWIRWARPVWYAQDWAPDGDGIAETNVLNVAVARDSTDERHICPLQLPVIERIVKLWSAPDELVFSPFAGIGSEGYEVVRLGRRFVGIELKESYWRTACKNLRDAEALLDHQSLFGVDAP